jgi:hypothetical protein
MSISKINPRTTVLLMFMIAVAIVRVLFSLQPTLSPIATFTPLGAMCLFGGAYFSNNYKAYLFPLITLWLGDVALNRLVYYHEWRFFYEGFYWTYGSFALMVLASKWLIKKVTVKSVILASVAATLIHWIGTSPTCFSLPVSVYPRTWSGYWASLIGAIPYERNFLIGTLVYSGILFGMFEWLQNRYTSLKLKVTTIN